MAVDPRTGEITYDALDVALLDLHDKQNRGPEPVQPWAMWQPAAGQIDPAVALRYVPPRPTFRPPLPDPVRYPPEQLDELLRLLADAKVMTRDGKFISLGPDPLTRLRTDRDAWIIDTEDAMVQAWQRSDQVLAAAEAEQALVRERAAEAAQERQRQQHREDTADAAFRRLVAAGEPVADARDKVRAMMPDLDW